ncbi:MAG: sigma-70 family RNA polymerase sigma factor [Phycisphaerae bacterium]|nr:sigma-70 family RNA polymerase sigma factor [Phycisphaerae bacterium]
MRKIKSHNLAQLLMQLRFTPEAKRRAQLEAAEKLYGLVDKDKQYPYDFVCFHITGFQPKGEQEQEIIAGGDLRNDLQVFITKLSGKLATPIAEAGERVYTVEELAVRFSVATKTIDRWRARGLLPRKFVFDDGVHRLGFLESVVERFARENPELVACASRFRRLTETQHQQIIRQARSLAAKTSLSRHRIIGQIAEKLGIARETVRTLLGQYEKEHPNKPVFRRPLGRIQPAEAAELFRLHQQGVGIRQLMEQFDRSRAAVHRIINQRRAAALLARKIEYVPSDEFQQANAREQILGTPLAVDRSEPQGKIGPFELPDENGIAEGTDHVWEPTLLPEYMQVLKVTPVLSRDREIELFRRYNYLKYLVSQERHQLRLSKVPAGLLSRLEGCLDEAEEIRTLLVEANLRLVVSIAGKHTSDGPSFLELVSKGNFALIQAVEEFDYAKGFRFSRRASLDIAKEYAKVSGRSTELTPKRAASLASIQRDMRDTTADVLAIERTRQDLAEVIRQELDEREQYVILHHFGLTGSAIRKNTKTLKQIGEELDLTKERIRQIELSALQKLRQCLSREQFEMLTG